MKQIPTHIDQLILDYLSGDLNEKNIRKLNELLAKSDELREYKERIEEIWNGESKEAESFNAKHAFYKFKRRALNEIEKGKRQTRIISLKPYVNIAAAIAVLIIVGFGAFQIGFRMENQNNPVTIACAAGENANLTLPDGSKVWLNSASSLTYYKGFNKKRRNVYLKGEAFFKVESNKKNPFTVNAQDMKVTATGTQFNVMAYDNENHLKASLIEGLVEVSAGNKILEMKAGEAVSVDKNSLQFKKGKITNQNALLGWREGKLIFKNESLASLKNKFERFYNVNINMEAGVDTIRFSGTLQYESIDELLNILHETQGIVAVKKGNDITLKASGSLQ